MSGLRFKEYERNDYRPTMPTTHVGSDPIASASSNMMGGGSDSSALSSSGLVKKPKSRKWGRKPTQEEQQQQQTQQQDQHYDMASQQQHLYDDTSNHSSPRVTSTPSKRTVDVKPQLSAKQQAAMALFAGLDGGASSTSSPSPPVSNISSPGPNSSSNNNNSVRGGGRWGSSRQQNSDQHQQQQQQQRTVASTPDLIPADIFSSFETDTAPVQQQQQQQQQIRGSSSETDLFGFSEPQHQQQEQKRQPVDPLEDIFGSSGGDNSSLIEPEVVRLPFQPEPIQTKAYGALWKKSKSELKFSVAPTSCTTPAEFMSRISARLGLHPVETIKQECICAGKNPDTGNVVLVHGKIRQGRVEVITRSTSNADVQASAQHVRGILV